MESPKTRANDANRRKFLICVKIFLIFCIDGNKTFVLLMIHAFRDSAFLRFYALANANCCVLVFSRSKGGCL